jgi:tRNA pseudouridine55 synthase
MTVDGLLLVDKVPACTSHDVVQSVRRIFRQKRVGHCGTLDPDATGLLLVTLGNATRLTRFLIHAPKIYEGEIRFGIATDTYDSSGKVVSEASTAGLNEDLIDSAMPRFLGTFDQHLPAFSARKIQGVKFYELARRGEEVPDATKEVTVAEFARTGPLGGDRIPFRLSCSSGTYARALAHDLGAALGCGAHLASLRRSAIGPFRIEDALPLDEIARRREQNQDPDPAWLPLDQIPLPFSEVLVDGGQERRLRDGQTVLVQGASAGLGDWIRLADRRGALIAIGSVTERVGAGTVAVVQPRIVFPSASAVIVSPRP